MDDAAAELLARAQPERPEVDNAIEIRDHRNPAVWPAGAKPVTKKATYDDLYRLTKIRYEYASGDDTWVDPFAAETTGTNPDARRFSAGSMQTAKFRKHIRRVARTPSGQNTGEIHLELLERLTNRSRVIGAYVVSTAQLVGSVVREGTRLLEAVQAGGWWTADAARLDQALKRLKRVFGD